VDPSEPTVAGVAAAILDGTAVDWATVQSTTTEGERQLLEQLRVLASLADFHRNQNVGGDAVRGPQTWGHIRVLEPIGSGAFGDVYRAWDTRLDREVALKLMPAGSDRGDARATSMMQEGRLLARVRHPNVVTIYGAECIGDTVGLWMERIDGETIEQRLVQGPLPPSDAIEIAIQICHAVSAVHEAGLLHRDIKAQNVMLAKDGRAVLTDFGTGWQVSDGSAGTASLAGTPLYLAPELLRDGNATIHSDIYSLGVLLYHMLTGMYPVHARSLPDLRLAHEHSVRSEVVGTEPGLPPALRRIIERAIDPCAERRYRNADALAAALGTLTPRPSIVPVKYATAVAAALVVATLLVVDGRLRHTVEPTSTQATASIAGGSSRPEADSKSAARDRLVRLTTSSGLNIDPALSPDGSLLAYSSDRAGTGNFDIWVQPIAGGNPSRVTTDSGDEIEPSFSPDGTSIVFAKSETGGVYVVGVSGGEPRQVVAAKRAHSPRFSPDGRRVVYWTGQTVWTSGFGPAAPDVISAVYQVRSDGGSQQTLTHGFMSARYAIWSPDGHRILFLGDRKTDGPPTHDWYVVRPDGSDPKPTGAIEAIEKAGVTGVPVPGAWTTSGDVVFTTATEDQANVWRLPISPETGLAIGVPRRLTFGTAIERSPVMGSPNQLAFASIVENVDIWRLPLEPTTGIASGGLERVTDDAAADRLQNVSADGQVVALISSRTKPEQVWLKDMQTGRERQITDVQALPGGAQEAQVSPDGSRVAVNVGRRGVVLYASNGGQPSTLCADCSIGGWSSDGSRMLIGRGRRRLILEIGSSREVALAERSNWSLQKPRFSRDGRWVVFHTTNAPDLRQIYAVPAFLGATAPPDQWVPVVTDFGIQPTWSPEGTSVYYFSIRDGFFCVWLQPVDVTTKRPIGQPRAVLHLHEPRLRAAVRAMPTNDVQRGYLYMTLTESSSNIWMLDTRRDASENR
jgi:serine/threonine protein kinase